MCMCSLFHTLRHPDKNNQPEAKEKFIEINRAYEVSVFMLLPSPEIYSFVLSFGLSPIMYHVSITTRFSQTKTKETLMT